MTSGTEEGRTASQDPADRGREGRSPMVFWKDRSVFVTGAGGFLGSWLAGALVDAGARVVCLLREPSRQSNLARTGTADRVESVRGDLADLALLQRILNEKEIEVVFHLAAQAIVGVANRSPVSTFESNIRGTYHLLEACRLSPWVKAIIVASSGPNLRSRFP